MQAPDWIWFGSGAGARAMRALLRPAELLYAGAVAARGRLYDTGLLHAETPALPVLSVGNLTVGGTGKTPVAAWAASVLLSRGARPGIVLRGYGDDEPKVHEQLNPGIPVLVTPVRTEGVRAARARGCDVAVLDDAFQHRRIARTEDWVLVSADRWQSSRHLLPAGPWREPLSGLRRASVVVVTRKAATSEVAAAVLEDVLRAAPGLRGAVVSLALGELRAVHGDERLALPTLAGRRIVLIAGIGDPRALQTQLERCGATVRPLHFGDHHAFTASDVEAVARGATGGEVVVCTLKDAVKIGAGWPRAGPSLWYVSQRVTAEEGASSLSDSLDALLRARLPDPDAAPSRGPHL